MKMSEAIRVGSRGTKKATGEYIRTSDGMGGGGFGGNNEAEYACAVGAACLAAGFDFTVDIIDFFGEKFPILKKIQDMKCHLCGTIKHSLANMIFHMNDNHMSREAIAEWVETLENKLEGDKQEGVQGTTVAPPACAVEKTQEVYPVVSTLA
jgi:hypothetical protein